MSIGLVKRPAIVSHSKQCITHKVVSKPKQHIRGYLKVNFIEIWGFN